MKSTLQSQGCGRCEAAQLAPLQARGSVIVGRAKMDGGCALVVTEDLRAQNTECREKKKKKKMMMKRTRVWDAKLP